MNHNSTDLGILAESELRGIGITVDEHAHLCGLIKKGKSSAQSNLKARILLKAD